MSETHTFIERALRGEIFAPDEEIDDAIDTWHEGGTGVPLNVWLGLTVEEYALFAEQPRHLGTILKARRYGLDLGELVTARDEATFSLAARGLDTHEQQDLIAWLKRTGRM